MKVTFDFKPILKGSSHNPEDLPETARAFIESYLHQDELYVQFDTETHQVTVLSFDQRFPPEGEER